MRNKMNLNVVAENEEEREIEKYLNILHNSVEVKKFMKNMEKLAKDKNVFKYRARIKNIDSAIRTYRINNKKIDEVHDYLGFSFITNSEKEIYPIIDYLKNIMPSAELIDFVDEEYIYSPLVYIKWVPPLGFNLFAKEELIQGKRKVPIEIRVCSKEAYISEQSAYYSVQKNDTTGLPIEEKNKLRNFVQHITYKLALLNERELTKDERVKHSNELNSLISNNRKFLKQNYELCRDAVLDFGRLLYRCENDSEMMLDEEKLSQNEIDKIDDKLKNQFNYLLEKQEGNFIEAVEQAVKSLRNIKYTQIKNGISDIIKN